MKKVIYIGWLLLLPMQLMAQGQGVQIAPKGGVSMWRGGAVESSMTPMGGLDLGYIARWRVMRDMHLGCRIGVGATYTTCHLTGTIRDAYQRTDYLGNTLEYTNSALAEEQHQMLNIEVPALLTLRASGVVLNVGPKLLLVVGDRYEQTVNQSDINAYFPAYKVTVQNSAPTGLLLTPYTQSGKNGMPLLNVLLSAEVGYEWQLGNRYSRQSEHYLGIQAFVDYGLWGQQSKQEFLSVAPITANGQHPAVRVGTIPAAVKLNYMSFGLRLYYTIQSVDYESRGWHRHHR